MQTVAEHIVETRRSCQKYDLIYRHDPEQGRTWLHSYILHEGYHLFAVMGIETKLRPPCRYYVVAQNQQEAKRIWKAVFVWFDGVQSAERCDAETERRVCLEFWRHIDIIL